MKNSNQFINESVFNVNLKYSRLQNETKELFFKCLDEGRDLEYFKAKLEELWGKVNRKYYQEDIEEYAAIIHEYNIGVLKVDEDIPIGESALIAFIPIASILTQEKKFIKTKEREYKNSLNSKAYEIDKKEYLKLKVQRYTSQIVPYYSKETGELIRYVQLSTYSSMIHNTNLTRAGWNTTLNDADNYGRQLFWIPPHSFSCPYCAAHQGKLLTRNEVMEYIGREAVEQEGDILHPNCKCTLTIYDDGTKLVKSKYSNAELEEQYEIRQKVNTLTLKKEQIRTDMLIQKRLGNQDEVDKLNQQRNKINSQIRELKEALPTAELQKQVVAINR